MAGEQLMSIEAALYNFSQLSGNFDINAAFQDALFGVASEQELQLDQKVRRMEHIITESNSEIYRDFLDFRSLAAQMEMMCNHDHTLADASKGSELLSSFMDGHSNQPGASHDHNHEESKKHKKHKAKKKLGWLSLWSTP